MKILTGKIAPPVSADIVRLSPAPKLTVATANTPVPLGPGIFTMPSPLRVAVKAIRSGVGLEEAEKRRVLSPEMIGAGSELAQLKLNWTSAGANGAVGVSAKTKLWAATAGMSTGVLGELVI